jgi:hypothetical protein
MCACVAHRVMYEYAGSGGDGPCILILPYYRNSHQITLFKEVTAESYTVETRTAEPRRVKTAQKLHRSKARTLYF